MMELPVSCSCCLAPLCFQALSHRPSLRNIDQDPDKQRHMPAMFGRGLWRSLAAAARNLRTLEHGVGTSASGFPFRAIAMPASDPRPGPRCPSGEGAKLARFGPVHASRRRPLQYSTYTVSVPATDEPFRQLQLQWSLTGEPTAQMGSLRSPQEPSQAAPHGALRGTQSTKSPLPMGLQVPFAVGDTYRTSSKGAVLCCASPCKLQATQHFRHPTSDPDLEPAQASSRTVSRSTLSAARILTKFQSPSADAHPASR
ncbi:hypothetical protein BBK36DRAFT_1186605 [Trichoderma citrinoviride]|uniref:Uncharacterized protein n=1 Tax=Trichoderma citrinoviride TaxID=58853 RepID=A0A2T4BIY8_9HYPO|nr:hypothetical protein BBK36DRAFT_1186605 [Trichoderma citrinoviride]PTB69270.1 hypothetical protein BBK36DRAFT_1186605 [Trichoderma citrinoviride]